MSVKVGMKMLYCKVAGDKSTEEIVRIVSVYPNNEGAIIFIPSIKRERNTMIDRLYMDDLSEVVRIVSFCGDACCIINIPSTKKTRLVYFSGLESVTQHGKEIWAKWHGISKTVSDRLSQEIIEQYSAAIDEERKSSIKV